MVVSNLAIIKDLLGLGQTACAFAAIGLERKERCDLWEVVLNTAQSGRHLRVDVVTKESGIHTWVGSHVLLVETLDDLERIIGCESIAFVALHLKGGEVKEARSVLHAFLLLHGSDLEGEVLDAIYEFLSLFEGCDSIVVFLRRQLGREECIAIEGLEFPIGAWHEVLNLVLAFDNKSEGWGLYATNAEDLAVLAHPFGKAQGISAGGIHTEQPVANSTHESRLVEVLVLALVLEFLEALADSIFGERRDPEAFDGYTTARLLIHPTLDELSLLPGITAVNNFGGLSNEVLDGVELLDDALVVGHLDAKALGYHGQRGHVPALPLLVILVGIEQSAEVSKRPGDTIPIAFHIAVTRGGSTQHASNIASHGGFLGYTEDHRLVNS